jgi:hypothetical protein
LDHGGDGANVVGREEEKETACSDFPFLSKYKCKVGSLKQHICIFSQFHGSGD